MSGRNTETQSQETLHSSQEAGRRERQIKQLGDFLGRVRINRR
jgi:hypothetical protein